MFEILGDEIYQGDSYVFLRELLQNSIDAIRVRREVLRRNGITPGEIGAIQVNVEHGQNGDAVITWEDDGIGMDDYIIRNYFAIAGKSYYRSADFEREDLNIDPISRFGIGFLSCFMVADHVEISTFKDPYLPPSSEPLRINIPAINRQFRIEAEPREFAFPGTKIKVFVNGRKLRRNNENLEDVERLSVTSYLSAVAGFVEFPIIINEDEVKTIIIHPKQNLLDITKRFGEAYSIKKIDQNLLLRDEILPQDLTLAQEFLSETSFDISTDLKLDGYEGTIAYFVPKDDAIDIEEQVSTNDIMITLKNGSKHEVRFGSISPDSLNTPSQLYSRSARPNSDIYRVYRDGILLSSASQPSRSDETVLPVGIRMTVNLPKSKAERIDLARTEIIQGDEHWSTPIYNALLRRLNLNDLLHLNPSDRLYQLCRLCIVYGFSTGDYWDNFPLEQWPLAVLEKEGGLTISEWQDILGQPINTIPRNLNYQTLLKNELLGQKQSIGFLKKWAGKQCVIPQPHSYPHTGNSILKPAIRIIRFPIEESYRTSEIQFLTPPFDGFPPLIQDILIPADKKAIRPDANAILERISTRSSEITIAELRSLQEQNRFSLNWFLSNAGNVMDNIEQFSSNFNYAFAYGFKYFNFSHPITRAMLECYARSS